jgi:hypothetical protein
VRHRRHCERGGTAHSPKRSRASCITIAGNVATQSVRASSGATAEKFNTRAATWRLSRTFALAVVTGLCKLLPICTTTCGQRVHAAASHSPRAG